MIPKTSSASSWFDDVCEAVRFLTVFKLPSRNFMPENGLARAMIFFPAVGLVIGGLSFVCFNVASSFFPPRIATLFLLIAPILMSGGLHMDGFADFCDGFFGGKSKTDILRIMKDPNVGALGAVGVALLMLVKFELLCAVPDKIIIFLLAMAVSRWSQVVLSFFLPYAGLGGGMSQRVAGKITSREVLGATLFLMPFLFWLGKEEIFILAGVVPFLFLIGLYFKSKIGGVTGDLLGAASELTEVFVFLFATGLANHG